MKLTTIKLLIVLLALLSQLTIAQERVVSGIVSDNTGIPLPGVSILVKGTKIGTQTDFDGKYSIKASPNQILIFSYVGMKTQEITASSSKLNIKLSGSTLELEDVVITTALDIKRKPKELSYSVENLKSEDLTKTKAVNIATVMAGKVSGHK